MYQNTIPLLMANFPLVSTLVAVNVTPEDLPKICLEYSKSENTLILEDQQPKWIEDNLLNFLELQVKQSQSLKTEIHKRTKDIKRRKGKGI
jgi:hypothetical protein